MAGRRDNGGIVGVLNTTSQSSAKGRFSLNEVQRALKGGVWPEWSPSVLFAAGEQGVWYDPSDFSTMFQDAAGTTPVTAIEQPVGRILDKSGRGNHASQSTTTSRPILRNLYNLLTYTEQFDNAVWVKTQSSISATNSTTAPDGTVTADTFIQIGTGSEFYYTLTARPAGTYTSVIYVKKITGDYFRHLIVASGGEAYVSIGVDLNTGALGTPLFVGAGWAFVSASAEQVANGFWKLTLTGTITALSVTPYYVVSTTLNEGTRLVNGSVYVWGASLVPANEASLPYQRVVTNALGSGVYDTDLSKFKPYLAFDGTDDSLVTGNINFSATDKMSVFSGVRKLSDSAVGVVVELSIDNNTSNGSFVLSAPASAGQTNYAAVLKGTLESSGYRSAPFASPITNVWTVLYNIGAPTLDAEVIPRVNGTVLQSSTAGSGSSTGAGNFGEAYPLYIGRRGGTTLTFNGRIYSLIVRGALTSDTQLEKTENWVNSKTGAY